jgi:hypothetical protein
MKKVIPFGLIRFYLTFLVLDANDWDATTYEVDRIIWADTEEDVDLSALPSLLDDFKAYLKAILPALAKGAKPEAKPHPDYYFRTAAEKAAWMYDDAHGHAPHFDTKDAPAPQRQSTYNPHAVKSHTSTWVGNVSMISFAF